MRTFTGELMRMTGRNLVENMSENDTPNSRPCITPYVTRGAPLLIRPPSPLPPGRALSYIPPPPARPQEHLEDGDEDPPPARPLEHPEDSDEDPPPPRPLEHPENDAPAPAPQLRPQESPREGEFFVNRYGYFPPLPPGVEHMTMLQNPFPPPPLPPFTNGVSLSRLFLFLLFRCNLSYLVSFCADYVTGPLSPLPPYHVLQMAPLSLSVIRILFCRWNLSYLVSYCDDKGVLKGNHSGRHPTGR